MSANETRPDSDTPAYYVNHVPEPTPFSISSIFFAGGLQVCGAICQSAPFFGTEYGDEVSSCIFAASQRLHSSRVSQLFQTV